MLFWGLNRSYECMNNQDYQGDGIKFEYIYNKNTSTTKQKNY